MDLETPLSFFKRLDRDRYAFLLESVEGSERWARYSFLGTQPFKIFKAKGSRVTILEDSKKKEFTSAAPQGTRGAPSRIPSGERPRRAAIHRWRDRLRGL